MNNGEIKGNVVRDNYTNFYIVEQLNKYSYESSL